jgi:hypothetical protein
MGRSALGSFFKAFRNWVLYHTNKRMLLVPVRTNKRTHPESVLVCSFIGLDRTVPIKEHTQRVCCDKRTHPEGVLVCSFIGLDRSAVNKQFGPFQYHSADPPGPDLLDSSATDHVKNSPVPSI